jgi:hypothetical protein
MRAEAISHQLEQDATEERIRTTSEVAAQWAQVDPRGAAAWVESLPEGEHREWAARNVVMNWARYGEEEARAWVAQRDNPEERSVLEAVLAGDLRAP